WEARWQGLASKIKAGEYELEPGLTPRRLLGKLVRGKVVQRTLTVVEGWNFTELMAAVRANGHLLHTLEEDSANAVIMERIGFSGQHPEGRFYPDTYHFPHDTTDIAFLKRAYATMARKLSAQWAQKAEGLPYDTPDEALIMASIVEKETGKPEERTQVAGVFVRRLKRGMRLQSDPTVIYGMGAAFTGNIRRADLTRPTPYNTYTIRALPPTPIAMPGEAAIHAALHPADGKALYFVAKGNGGHQFSATLIEHNRAVARYQLRRKTKGKK
ncbi:MAG: endolytic transglycosylase MltG, partial [Gammaproteobacteria bacterium]|nr:endolytic transglycosylase MltG [Gammaproteobacteria bacterium]